MKMRDLIQIWNMRLNRHTIVGMIRNYQFKRKINFDIETYRSLVEREQFGKHIAKETQLSKWIV